MCNYELVLVKFSLCWDGRILHFICFICDGAKEFLFVKRMPKQFESEFNMLASMFHDHLLLENQWSHCERYMKGQPSH